VDGERRRWTIDGHLLDLYEVAALQADPVRDAVLVPAVAAAELHQAGVIAVDRDRLIRAAPLPAAAHPVERAVYEAIPDWPLLRPERGGRRLRRRRTAKRQWRPRGRTVLRAALDDPTVRSLRERLAAEHGLTRPRAHERFRAIADPASVVAALAVFGALRLATALLLASPPGVPGFLLALAELVLAATVTVRAVVRPRDALGRRVYLTPSGRRAYRALREQSAGELRALPGGRREPSTPAATAPWVGTALALQGDLRNLDRWDEPLAKALDASG